MTKMFWNPQTVTPELNTMLKVLKEYDYAVDCHQGDTELRFRFRDDGGLKVCRNRNSVDIAYGTLSEAMRGISFALAGQETEEKMPFSEFGIMLDCSRNKVFTIGFLKKYCLQAALFGCNNIVLYAEDTYQLPNEPFFGYMRGGYSLEELQELDNFCHVIGVELSAGIQTLGHMEHLLQWEFAYGDMMETPNVLLAGNEKVYALIDKMLAFWSKALRSRKIHLGMDEAHDLGRGKNFDLQPSVPPQELFHRHLERVNGIAAKYGYASPMIWSDMYFRLSNIRHKYYGCDKALPEEVAKRIPANVRLCYWDYYHETEDFYDKYIDLHRAMGFDPIMFSGLWTWAKFWYDHQFTEKTIRPCISVCRRKGVKELYFTMWGDDGGYCCYPSALAGLCFAADLAVGESDEEKTAQRYNVVTGGDYHLTMELSRLEYRVIDNPDALVIGDAASLLWDDPLLAINWRGLRRLKPNFPVELDNLLMDLLIVLERSKVKQHLDSGIQMLESLMRFLLRKYRIRGKMEELYLSGDRAGMGKLVSEVHLLAEEMRLFMEKFRNDWLNCAKRFGMEVHQKRHAGQLERIFELERTFKEWSEGVMTDIPELDASCGMAEMGYQRIHYRHCASGSAIK